MGLRVDVRRGARRAVDSILLVTPLFVRAGSIKLPFPLACWSLYSEFHVLSHIPGFRQDSREVVPAMRVQARV
jgi:hypothetical protein